MDPLTTTTGSIQIVHLCARSKISLTRWTGKVRAIDEHVDAFCSEINSLSATYEALNNGLRAPGPNSRARILEHVSDERMWQQLSYSIKDCENSMLVLNDILKKFLVDLGNPFRQGHEQFGESISSGDISRLRQRIRLFKIVLALPLQMTTM